ncbi:MAG: hypothetical protein ACFCVK_07350 [Acidimicrobiales bacterium]
MTKVKASKLTSLAIACLLAAGCSSPPSQDELTEAILAATEAAPDIELSPAQASCMAERLIDSDLSETTLAGLAADFANPEVLRSETEDVERLVSAAALACASRQ